MARVIGRSEATKRNTRGTKMLEAAIKELQREAQEAKRATQAYKTPSPKAASPNRAPPKLGRKNPRKCQFV